MIVLKLVDLQVVQLEHARGGVGARVRVLTHALLEKVGFPIQGNLIHKHKRIGFKIQLGISKLC